VSEQLPLFEDVPVAHARRGDRDTSHEAARVVTPKLTAHQEMVLKVINRYFGETPFTDKDLVRTYQVSWEARDGLGLMLQADSGIRTRRNELFQQGLLEEAGTRKIGKTNHTLWRRPR
jgi:hypothetical protein